MNGQTMADGVSLNLMDTLQNPGGNFELAVHDDEFPTEAFNTGEAELLERQLNALFADMDSAMMTQALKQREEAIAKVATFAKQELDGKVFGGINAGDNQIGVSILRPGHIRADPATGNAENDWYFDPGTTGWTDWIGDGGANNYSVGEDQVSVVFGFVDQDVSSEVSGINVEEFGRNMDMLPHDTNGARLRDNETEVQYTSLPTLVAQDNDQVHVKIRADRDVESQPRLFGLTFALGGFLNSEDY